jgi:tRNA-specific 2-thiouridylase
VARKDMASNTLYVAQGHEHPWLCSQHLNAIDASWISGSAPLAGAFAAKTRYRQTDANCTLDIASAGFALQFTDSQWAVTPGQSAVVYDGDVCLGGGIISASLE